PLDVHLMIVEPERYIPEFVAAGADLVTGRVEACPHLARTLAQIRELGAKAGVALNPSTPPSALEFVLDELDLVLVMSVNPGFGGQSFIRSAHRKIREVKALLGTRPVDLSEIGRASCRERVCVAVADVAAINEWIVSLRARDAVNSPPVCGAHRML